MKWPSLVPLYVNTPPQPQTKKPTQKENNSALSQALEMQATYSTFVPVQSIEHQKAELLTRKCQELDGINFKLRLDKKHLESLKQKFTTCIQDQQPFNEDITSLQQALKIAAEQQDETTISKLTKELTPLFEQRQSYRDKQSTLTTVITDTVARINSLQRTQETLTTEIQKLSSASTIASFQTSESSY